MVAARDRVRGRCAGSRGGRVGRVAAGRGRARRSRDVNGRARPWAWSTGRSFQGLEAAWRDGDDVYAEVALPDEADTGRFRIHPALLDAALHPLVLDGGTDGSDEGDAHGVRIPFVWTGVALHAVGATRLRVRLSPSEQGGVALALPTRRGLRSPRSRAWTCGPSAPNGSSRRRAEGRTRCSVDWAAVDVIGAPGVGGGPVVLGDQPELAAASGAGAAYEDLPDLVRAVRSGATVPALVLAVCDPVDGVGAETAHTVSHRMLGTGAGVARRGAVRRRPAAGGDPRCRRRTGRGGHRRSGRGHGVGSAALAQWRTPTGSRWSTWTTGPPPWPYSLPRWPLPPKARSRSSRSGTVPSSCPGWCARTRDRHWRYRKPVPAWRVDIPEKGTLDNLAIVAAPDASEPLVRGRCGSRYGRRASTSGTCSSAWACIRGGKPWAARAPAWLSKPAPMSPRSPWATG